MNSKRKETIELARKWGKRSQGFTSKEIVKELGLGDHRTTNNILRSLVNGVMKGPKLKRIAWTGGIRGGKKWLYHISDPEAALKTRKKEATEVYRLRNREKADDERLAAILPEVAQLTGASKLSLVKSLKLPESFVEKSFRDWAKLPLYSCECGWRGKNPIVCEAWDSGKPEKYYRCPVDGCGLVVA